MQIQRFGPYEVVRLIGTGGMGRVYLAERADRQFTKQVAVKVLQVEDSSPQALQRFLAEQQTLATLDHPSIVRLLDGGVTADGQPFYIMDYVEGTPLDEYVKRTQPGIDARLRLFLQLCDAVAFAHRRLIVHRDLKPRNILVTADGLPKLLDFGIAKLLRPQTTADVTVSTRAFSVLTLEYASPEQIHHAPVTTAVDVYALGVVLYELLSGRWPYRIDSKNDVAVAYAVCHAEPEPLACNRDLDAIVAKAMRKQPEERYDSVQDLADDVQRHLHQKPIHAIPASFRYRMGKLVMRHRGAFAAGALAVAVALAGVVGVVRQSRIAEQQRALAADRFEGLRQLLGTFLFDVHDDIRDLPGSAQARSLIVNKASTYLRWLSEQAGGDARLQLDLADAHLKLGGVLGDPYETNMGRTEEGLAAIEKGRRIALAVLEKDKDNARARRYVALAAFRRVNILTSRNEPEEAMKLARFSLAEFQKLAASQPDAIEPNLDLALAGELLADLETVRGNHDTAMRFLNDSIAAMRTILRLDGKHFRARRALVVLRMKLADQYRDSGNTTMAQTTYQMAAEDLAKLQSESPRHSLRRLQAILVSRTGHLKYELKQYRSALDSYTEEVRLLESLASLDENDQRAQFDLSVALRNIAETSWFLDNNDDALRYSKRGQEILERAAKRDPANLVAQERHAQMLLETGYYYSLLKRMAEAEQHSARGLALLSDLVKKPGVSVNAMHTYAEWLLTAEPPSLRNPRAALPYAEQAVARTGGAHFAYVDTLGKSHAAAGNVDKALELVEAALKRLPDDAPTHQRAVFENRLAQYRKMAERPSAPAPR
ncbi:MAG: protein kinase [Bryobacterales bacterium]|nr:protein kinase [Bryobacterales bacterium]